MANKENERSERVVKVKGRKKQKRILKSLIIIISVALLLVATLYVVPQVRNHVNSSKDGESENKVISSERKILSVMPLSSGNILITTDSVVSFNTNGTEKYTESLGYTNPVYKSADKKYIVFERSTGKYTVGDKSKIVCQGDLDEEIINADVASNGNWAVITGNAQSKMRLSVRNSKNKEIFAWECSDDYLTDVAMSKNGKSVAVSSINVVNGDPYSHIYYFNIDSLEVEGKIEYPNETVYKIKFIDNKKVSVITDISYMIADMNERRSQVISYEYDTLSGYSFGKKSSVAILKKGFGSLNEKNLTVIDKNGECVFEKTVESEILDFTADTKRVYVLIPGNILAYSISSGEISGDVQVDAAVTQIELSSKTLLGIAENAVYKYEIE